MMSQVHENNAVKPTEQSRGRRAKRQSARHDSATGEERRGEKKKKDDVEKWHGRLRLFKRERRARRKCILIPSASTINTQRGVLVQMRSYFRVVERLNLYHFISTCVSLGRSVISRCFMHTNRAGEETASWFHFTATPDDDAKPIAVDATGGSFAS